MSARDTIAAIATAPGRGGIGVVRVSGRDLGPLIRGVVCDDVPARHATLRNFLDHEGEPIDHGIVLHFPFPHSYTGEDVVEFQGHGGPLVLQRLLQRCLQLGARLADPGEFTRRALLNGKLDLVQAESVIDLIDATTTQALRCAARSMQGDFSREIQRLSAAITEIRMKVEATIDFPEEEVELGEGDGIQSGLRGIRASVERILASARQGSLLREGMHVVLAGQPNVGKSSLLNALAGEELAIVTPIPGTTRDPVRQAIDIEGVPIHVIDTAGLRASSDPVERLGIDRAWERIQRADAVLVVIDASLGAGPSDYDITRQIPLGVPRVMVMNKIDLIGRPAGIESGAEGPIVWLSARSRAGIDDLKTALLELCGWEGREETVFLARERHVQALRQASAHLEAARAQLASIDLVAEELRLAHRALTAITGEFTADDLLGEIFSKFCIGK